MVAGAGDLRRPAVARVEHLQRQMEAGEIDRRGQPGRAAADDQAIERGVVHPASSAAAGGLFPSGASAYPAQAQ